MCSYSLHESVCTWLRTERNSFGKCLNRTKIDANVSEVIALLNSHFHIAVRSSKWQRAMNSKTKKRQSMSVISMHIMSSKVTFCLFV